MAPFTLIEPGPPISDTHGERRNLRRDVRNKLGFQREPAPNLRALVGAVRSLHRLVFLTTGGRWAVAIVPGGRHIDARRAAIHWGHVANESRDVAFALSLDHAALHRED